MADQIAFPVAVVGGQLQTVTDGTDTEVGMEVEILCLTPPGWFPGLPGFGLADQAFRKGGADVQEIERQIATWVPRAADAVQHDRSALDAGLDRIGVQVSAR
jgi:hypothetical protein